MQLLWHLTHKRYKQKLTFCR